MPAWTLIGPLLCAAPEAAYVRVSPRDPRYFELSDGTPYLPLGLNMIAPPGDRFDAFEAWLDALAAQGGNYLRVWLTHRWFDIEHAGSGRYDDDRAQRLDQLLAACAARGLKVKLCLEHWRHFGTTQQAWADRSMHLLDRGGTARDIADWFSGEPSRERFRGKLDWYAQRIGERPEIFAWELWNEINATAGGDVLAWTTAMLPELRRRFPRNLACQSLGSFDTAGIRTAYQRLATMPDNQVAQVHRYLDLGAALDVCRGPMDLLAADAVRELLATNPGRPVILAESGAVEPSHSGPFKLYAADREGTLLHDVLFAPFFAGAAGPGHIWHWDAYVAKNNLWWHFGRFAEAVRGVDAPAEEFEPLMLDHPRLRVYVLRGRRTILAWCRDAQTTWQTELAEGRAPTPVTGAALALGDLAAGVARARAYDPWRNTWSEVGLLGERAPLPDFTRSLVLRLER